MRSLLLAAGVCTIVTSVVAQCGMTTELQGGTVYQGPATCPGYTWSVNTTGGTDGTVSYSGAANDRDPIFTAIGGSTPNNALNNMYDRRDTNLDGVIRYTGANNDRDPILTNVGNTTPNSTRTQQLP